MTARQRRLLLSVVALMWAEDKVRLEIGMPGAQRGEKKRAGDRRMRTGENSLRIGEEYSNTDVFQARKRRDHLLSN